LLPQRFKSSPLLAFDWGEGRFSSLAMSFTCLSST
jgi:hypothetical protein